MAIRKVVLKVIFSLMARPPTFLMALPLKNKCGFPKQDLSHIFIQLNDLQIKKIKVSSLQHGAENFFSSKSKKFFSGGGAQNSTSATKNLCAFFSPPPCPGPPMGPGPDFFYHLKVIFMYLNVFLSYLYNHIYAKILPHPPPGPGTLLKAPAGGGVGARGPP